MSNVHSRISCDPVAMPGQPSPILEIALRQAACLSINDSEDFLRRFPTEVRLMIFEELLIVFPKIILRGASKFGPLQKQEFDEDVKVPWQILSTCRKYYEEALPILYGKNKFGFCTGAKGSPGSFWRFPVRPKVMPYLTDLGVYFRADDPKTEASKRVGNFLRALNRHAKHLEHLTVTAASDRFYEAACPWDIVFGEHPVAQALVHLVKSKSVKHLTIRLQDGACFFPSFACFLDQTFRQHNDDPERSLTFTLSCTCPPGCPHHPAEHCFQCGWPTDAKATKPIEEAVEHPACVESCMGRMMDMQDDLFHLGILPPKDDDEEEIDEDEEYLVSDGPYRIPLKALDLYDELKPAFYSGILLPGEVRRYRGELKEPEVWSYRQTELDEFFKMVEYEEYLSITFGVANGAE